MLRMLAIAAAITLAVPTLATAQEHRDEHHPPGPGPHGPPGPGPHGPGPMVGPHPGPGGPPGRQFSFHGRMFNPIHAAPFVYPHGWAYRRWVIGAALPPIFLAQTYWYADWAALGLIPPQPGFQWVRYGPDLLLVNVATGQVVDVAYGVFY